MDVEPWKPETPWQADAEWLPNGLPANMDAVLHDQWRRIKHRRLASRGRA